MLTTLIVTQVLFDVGILVLVVVSFHWLHERLKDGAQVDAVLRTEELSGLKADIDRLAQRLESRTEDSLNRLEARIEEAAGRGRDLREACALAAESVHEALRAVDRAEELARRLRESREPLAESMESADEAENFQAVYLLADEMADIPEISRRTGLSQGEVEMILNLRSARPPRPQGGRAAGS